MWLNYYLLASLWDWVEFHHTVQQKKGLFGSDIDVKLGKYINIKLMSSLSWCLCIKNKEGQSSNVLEHFMLSQYAKIKVVSEGGKVNRIETVKKVLKLSIGGLDHGADRC